MDPRYREGIQAVHRKALTNEIGAGRNAYSTDRDHLLPRKNGSGQARLSTTKGRVSFTYSLTLLLVQGPASLSTHSFYPTPIVVVVVVSE